MSGPGPTRNIYAGFDELFDTRLGIINQTNPDDVSPTLDAGYYQRERDQFPMYTYEAFRALYATRTSQVLWSSIRTYILDMIIEALFKFHAEMINEPFRGLPILTINTYPYDVSTQERDELSFLIQAHAGEDFPLFVEYVHYSPKELTPKYVGETFSLVFMYDALYWMDLHGEHLEHSRMSQIDLICPGLFHDTEVVEEQVLDETSGVKIHPFEGLRILARQLVNLRFIPVRYFSAVSPENTLEELDHKLPDKPVLDELPKVTEAPSDAVNLFGNLDLSMGLTIKNPKKQ